MKRPPWFSWWKSKLWKKNCKSAETLRELVTKKMEKTKTFAIRRQTHLLWHFHFYLQFVILFFSLLHLNPIYDYAWKILHLVPIKNIVVKSIFRTPPWCMVLLHITQARLEPGKPSCEIFAVKREIYLTFAKYSQIRGKLCPKIWWKGKSFQSRLKSFCQIKGLSTFLSAT